MKFSVLTTLFMLVFLVLVEHSNCIRPGHWRCLQYCDNSIPEKRCRPGCHCYARIGIPTPRVCIDPLLPLPPGFVPRKGYASMFFVR
ncbi:hypothetical protein V5799_011070 [Amblyomma americanum]|uniref:Secreted protein n=1 Tax=Amblyomma americanum TaxID=6943 RepID=A0AAQ4EIC3_AMBAM